MKKIGQNWQVIFLLAIFLVFLFTKIDVLAKTSGEEPIKFENPIKYDKMEKLLVGVMKAIQGVVGILSIFMIVVAGLVYITSAGSNRTDLAKNIATGAMIGLAVSLAAPSFLKEIYNILGETPPSVDGVSFDKGLYDITFSATKAILGFIGVLAILMIIVGGVTMMVSGDSKNSEMGKKFVFWAVIGLVVALTSLIVVNTIKGVFE